MSLAAARISTRSASRTIGWRAAFPLLAALFFVAPLVSLLLIATEGGGSAFPRLSVIREALGDTALLLAGVAAITLIIAVPLAWCVARFEFPFRRTLEVLSVLPLALPGYLAAYAYVSLTDFFGPLQTGLRGLFGVERLFWFPDLRSLAGACFVMAATLYPYVYLPARWSFERQSARQIEAARNLGATHSALLFRIALPLAWPAIIAGLILALLETLNDIGATQYLGVNSLTVVTFTTWTVRDNLAGAAQLALLLLLIVAVLTLAERHFRRERRYADPARQGVMAERLRLKGWRGWAAAAGCALPFTLGFLAPSAQLMERALRDVSTSGVRPEIVAALGNTVMLAALATVLIILLGFSLVLGKRLFGGASAALPVQIASLGYGVPGLILVIGLMPLAGLIDRTLHGAGLISVAVISGSAGLLMAAYALRFTAIATGQAEAAMQRLSRNVDHAAATLGASRLTLGARILAPQLRGVAGAAAILIAVDCIKELPATLVLRPLNLETLSTLVYEAASRGAFEEGAVASMLIVLVGLVPLIVLFRLIARPG